MNLLVHVYATISAAEEAHIIEGIVLEIRHTTRDDIDVVTDGQLAETVTDFFGILRHLSDALRLTQIIETSHQRRIEILREEDKIALVIAHRINEELNLFEEVIHRSVDMYEKIHVTPDEQKSWGLRGGSHIQTFDTDCGKIGIVICYDVEFPELSRLMAEDGMQILFVPFMTDTQNAYSRVRVCAQARAIENECYVAIAGSVGNLPRVHNMDKLCPGSNIVPIC